MNLNKLPVQIQKLAVDNAPLVLTALGVAGACLTTYQTGRATFKAAKVITDAQFVHHLEEKSHEFTNKEKAKLVWKLYILPASTLGMTCTSIVYAHKISAARLAGLAMAYSIADKNFEEYKEKIQEKLGVGKEQAARDELAQERVNKNPPTEAQMMMVGGGDILCLDQFSGRYFKSDMETIRRAENDTNYQIMHQMYASVSDFYERVGLAPTTFSEEIGWNGHNKLELKFSSVITPDGKPAIAFDFRSNPLRNFDYTNCMGDS